MSKQKVLFEATPMLDRKKTGVGYYVGHLVRSLQQAYGNELELTGYYFNLLGRNKNDFPVDTGVSFHKIWLVPGRMISACRRLGFQPFLEFFVRRKADAIIFTNYVTLPQLRKRKTALVIYDLGFLDVPEFTQGRNLAYLKRFCPPSIRKADVIITISEFTKSRLKHHFPDSKAEIVVTPIPPADKLAREADLGENLTDKGVKAKSYVLYVGTIEPRKNLETLVAAYALLPDSVRERYALVLAGGKGWKDEAILAAVADQQAKGLDIILTGYVSEAEKDALYANAACFVLPSHYEGFGMPLLEAMQHGVPTAASDIDVFHEVASDAAHFFDKDDARDIAQKLSEILGDPGLAGRLASRGTARLKAFSWQENAARVYQALR